MGGLSVTGLYLIQPQGFTAPDNLHIQSIIFRATHKPGLHIALTVTTIVRNIDTGLAHQVDNPEASVLTGRARQVLNQGKFMVVADTGQ